MTSYISLQRIAYSLIIMVLTIYLLIIGQAIVSPVAFAIFLGFLVNPIMNRYERKVGRIAAIILTFLTILIPLLLVLSLFVLQSVEIFGNLDEVGEKLVLGVEGILEWLRQTIAVIPGLPKEWVSGNSDGLNFAPVDFLRTGVTSTTAFLANLVLTFIYTVLILLYRDSLKNFTLLQIEPRRREEARAILRRIQNVLKSYLHGLGLVMLILFCLNSFCLWLIGIQYPVFWGGLAAFLAVVPYLGTFIGGLLPFLFAVGTTGTVWQPLAVIGVFSLIQFLEGNFITPKVMGETMQINPFVAIFSLILGGAIWGLAGLVLALPVVAVLRVLLSEISFMEPVSVILSSTIIDKERAFLEKYDKPQYRLRSFFSRKQQK